MTQSKATIFFAVVTNRFPGPTITFDAEKGSILENARAAGLPAPYACKAGVCATCRAKLVKGDVKMKANYGLSKQEVSQGYVLTCQAIPLTDDVELDFDD